MGARADRRGTKAALGARVLCLPCYKQGAFVLYWKLWSERRKPDRRGVYSLTETTAYEYEQTIRYGYCDQRDRMRLSYLLKEVQQASMEHCDVLGIGLEYLQPRNQAFLLARQSARFFRAPKGGERVRVRTQPRVCGFQYPRTTSLFAMTGEELARVEAVWVLVDTQSRRILRRVPEEMAGFFPLAGTAPSLRLPRLEEPDLVLECRVPLHMTDSNHHLNNASYADLILDVLEERLLAGEAIAGLDICYHRELKTGEAFQLRRRSLERGALVDGVKDGLCHFESQVFF